VGDRMGLMDLFKKKKAQPGGGLPPPPPPPGVGPDTSNTSIPPPPGAPVEARAAPAPEHEEEKHEDVPAPPPMPGGDLPPLPADDKSPGMPPMPSDKAEIPAAPDVPDLPDLPPMPSDTGEHKPEEHEIEKTIIAPHHDDMKETGAPPAPAAPEPMPAAPAEVPAPPVEIGAAPVPVQDDNIFDKKEAHPQPQAQVPPEPVHEEKHEADEKPRREVPTEPVFVNVGSYKGIMDSVVVIKNNLKEAEEVIERMNGIKNEEDKEFEKWRQSLEDVQRKISYVDKVIFEAGS